ncbi:FTR1 family iron permease [Propionicicella superfundia]|uniref:FTR1 family iron permease n=1 Tax=Propionicicella superfundia TaxID=348582 RepID=UPI000419ADE6|nr:FTR1 family protein [Propionicicella superfundia]
MRVRRILTWLGALALAAAVVWGSTGTAAAQDDWQDVTESITSLLDEVPTLYADGDLKGVEANVRKAYYEEYQASGLEDEVKHRLGADRATAFQTGVVELRNLTRDGAPQADVKAAVAQLTTQLTTDVEEVRTAPEVSDRWGRVAQSIVETSNEALRLYEAGDHDAAFTEASRAYLEHYEADGLEKATLSYLSSGRVAEVEAEFRQIRMDIRDGVPVDDVRSHVETLNRMVTEDAASLDSLGANEAVGWSGFVASFLILLREGAEALLVVAAVITYVIKSGRRDQLRGVYLGIVAAIAVSVGLAVLFNSLTSSAALGLTQELIEGIAGALAAVMLIYISSWILSKSEGDAWHRYITDTVDKQSAAGGRWALFAVVFLAVAREGFETILFYIPVFGAAQTTTDHLLIWAGLAAAVVVLAVLFLAVRLFGVRLPLRPFFRWTSVLLAILAITITGGAVKEFQDAMLVDATPVAGVPQVTWLGLYPTVETLAAQGIVTVVVLALMLWQFRKSVGQPATPDDPAPVPADDADVPADEASVSADGNDAPTPSDHTKERVETQ